MYIHVELRSVKSETKFLCMQIAVDLPSIAAPSQMIAEKQQRTNTVSPNSIAVNFKIFLLCVLVSCWYRDHSLQWAFYTRTCFEDIPLHMWSIK